MSSPPSPFTPALRLASLLSLVLLVACGGQGCSGCGGGGLQNIPGGFSIAERKENAVQLRASKNMFDFLGANAAAVLGPLIPMSIPIPASGCGTDTQICCGGAMCSISAALTGLSFTPSPPQTTRLSVRARLSSNGDIPVKAKQVVTIDCKLNFNSARKSPNDIGIVANLIATVNPETRLTSLAIDANSVDIQDLQSDDIDIKGNFGCDLLDLVKGLFIGQIRDLLKKQLGGPLAGALDGALCQKCTDAKVDCPQFAGVSCPADKKVCTRGNACIQRIGLEGRIDPGGVLGGLSTTRGGALDIYAVAGGYATVEAAGGLSLGMIGGATVPAPSACVPARPAPTGTAPPKTAAFSGNTAPNGKPYHLGVGLSGYELDLLGHGFYAAGGLCLRLGTDQVAQLSSATLGALLPSLAELTRDQLSSVFIVMRPQQAPTFTLGKGTFKTDMMGRKTLDDPLLKIGVKDFAIDFYLYMDERYVRFMRMTADLQVPIGLDVDNMSQIVPILGDLDKALANVRVSDTALLKESPASLAALLPRLFPLLLGQVGSSIKPIALPSLMGFSIKPVQITATDGPDGKLAHLGLFLELGIAPKPLAPLSAADGAQTLPVDGSPAETRADLLSLEVPSMGLVASGKGHARAVLRVEGWHRSAGATEWQYAVDGGLWRPFDDRRELVVDDASLSLPGRHHIDVRSRVVGAPETLDATPARVEMLVSPAQPAAPATNDALQGFHGKPGEGSGCSCSAAGAPLRGADYGTAALLLGVALWLLPRRRRAQAALPAAVLASLAGAGCGSDTPMGPPAQSSDLFAEDNEIGRYLGAVEHDGTLYLSAYNSTLGDLAFAEVKDPKAETIDWQIVDGLPEGEPEDKTDGARRKGFSSPGPDVGRFTSLAKTKNGVPVIAYQDVSNNAVKLALGPARAWKISTVAAPSEGAKLGQFAQVALDGEDIPTVAYMATGIRKGEKIVSQMVVARARSASPQQPEDWESKVVDEAEMSCAGLCGMGQACVAQTVMAKATTSCKAIGAGCAAACGAGKACVDKACVDVLAAGPIGIQDGTGAYARLASSNTLLFYSRSLGALRVAEGPEWKPANLDGGDGVADVGQHSSGVYGEDGTLHVAYQDAVSDRVLYRTWKDGKAGAVEVVDNGVRGMDQHSVGAGALLFLDNGQPRVIYQDQTQGSLELAQRGDGMGPWAVKSAAAPEQRSKGYYPQAARLSGSWYFLHVSYNRPRETPLSGVEITAAP